MNTAELLAKLRLIVGSDHVLTRDNADLNAFETDWRQRHTGRGLAVVRPGNTQEVVQVVELCAQFGASLVPQGGNTGLVVGGVPDLSGEQVVLSLTRMNRVIDLDAANLTLTVQAGCVLQTAQQAAAQAGFLLPLSLAAEGSCTVGGNLATNAGGTQVLRYGNARELCLGLEVVTPQGEVWNGLSGLRKDNTGYDLRHLFIGSEGTLGVITAATLKLYPLAAAQLTAWAAVPSMQAAVTLLGLARRRLDAGLTGFEVMGQFPLGLVDKHFSQRHVPLWREQPYCVLLEHSDSESEPRAREKLESLLADALESGCVSNAVVAENLGQAQNLWQIRESISMAQAAEGLNIKHDISLPVSKIPAFCAETDPLIDLEVPGSRLVNFGHLGDGNLHYNVQAPVGVDPQVFLLKHEKAINTLVFDAVNRFGGSISAEHGIGSLKAHTLPRYKSPVALGMMRAIKRALDPLGIMNPGRVLLRDFREPVE